MRYVIKYKDFIDLDDDAMLVDADEINCYDNIIVFSANEIPILYVPFHSVMFIKMVGDDLAYKPAPSFGSNPLLN